MTHYPSSRLVVSSQALMVRLFFTREEAPRRRNARIVNQTMASDAFSRISSIFAAPAVIKSRPCAFATPSFSLEHFCPASPGDPEPILSFLNATCSVNILLWAAIALLPVLMEFFHARPRLRFPVFLFFSLRSRFPIKRGRCGVVRSLQSLDFAPRRQ